MTTDDTFGRTLSGWLHDEAEHHVPDHLAEVLVQTVATRQRPWWSSPERWLPMDTATGMRGRLAIPRPLVWVTLLALVLLAVLGTAIMTGALRSPAPALGPASNGRIVVADGTALKSYAPDGKDPKVIATLPAAGHDLAVSHDGSRVGLAVAATPGHMEIIRLSDGRPVTLPTPDGTVDVASAVTWAPDDQRVAFLTYDGTIGHLIVAPADGSSFTELSLDPITPTAGLWQPAWSPDGAWIAFIVADEATDLGDIYLIRPDGTDLHLAETSKVIGSGGVLWSPEPTVQRLLYTRPGNVVEFFDLTTEEMTVVGSTFWPTWSPDGERISAWGTKVISTADVMNRVDAWTQVVPVWEGGGCKDHPDFATKSFCGPASWSPDGVRLIAPDIVGTSVLSVLADGTGSPIVIPLETSVADWRTPVIWQPVRP